MSPPTYSGVSTVAHEIAHALGATHDGENRTIPIPGYPNELYCPWQDQYLMSPAKGGQQNRGRLSNCTVTQIKFLISTLSQSCNLVNTEAKYSNELLSRENMTRERFCQTMHPQQADVKPSDEQPSASGNSQCKIECCWPYDYGGVQEREEINMDDSGIFDDDSDYYYGYPKQCQPHSMPEAMPCGENKTCRQETLVYPRLLESRADDSDILLHVHEGLTLNLRKSSIFARDFVLTTSTDIGPENVVFNGTELERDLYHDTEHRSSLVVKRKENGVEVKGILNDQLRITPAVLFERSEEGLIPHEVFTVEERSSTPKNPSEHSKNEKTNKSNCAEKFVVELCVVAGPTYWCAFNGTEDLVTYIATAVNVNDSIAGKNICGTTLYELRNHNSCAADILDALNSTIDLANYCELKGCDVVLQLTSGDLAMEVNSTHINRKVQGVANFGGVCTNRSAAVAEDDPLVYSGVSTMAHEIAHALGASHDDDNLTLPINGYPDALNCSWEDGYLMSASGEGRNRHKLSNCSMTQIKFLVRSILKPTTRTIFYPGHNMTPEMFCRRKHPLHEDVQPDNQSATDYQNCKIDCCWKIDLGSVQARDDINADDSDAYDDYYDYGDPKECQQHHLLEAMSCGENKTCWRGVCGEHNWTDIYNTYHTYRTFETR
ncbi:hypothetical protein MTO96_031711 [Rhipicephalus appendiculatus]